MAHNLATIDGRISMAYQAETPWHGLGTRMGSTADVDAAIDAAQLRWTVSTQPLYLKDGRIVPERFAVIRDTANPAILGTVGPQFTPLQNTLPDHSGAFDVLRDACDSFGVTIESAGALGSGERVWMLAKMPEAIEPVPGDIVNGYFLIVNGHDGSQAYGARPTPIRVVCQNTLSAALQSGHDMIRIRHTSSAPARLSEAKRLVNGMFKALRETGETFSQLAARRMDPAEIAKYIESVFPADADGIVPDTLKQRRRDVATLVWAGRGAELAGADATGATAWAAYNAVTEYFDHVRPGQAKTVQAQAKANESAIFGGNLAIKVLALKNARQLVAA